MEDKITMAHGAGGREYRELVREVFLPAFDNAYLRALSDAAVCPADGNIAVTTDSYVINPLFFPGGDIGRLAVSGTVNDLAVSGAIPAYITCGIVIEAGFAVEDLKKIVRSMADTAAEAGVKIVTGDTKVVETGACDGLFINTAGVGLVRGEPPVGRVLPDDVIVASGCLGSHGLAVLAAREKMEFEPVLQSDVRPMDKAVRAVLEAGITVHAMRDPTRGGAAATLNEWAEGGVDIRIEEEEIPVRDDVRAVSELLGMDYLYAANEGVVLFAVGERDAEKTVAALRSVSGCEQAAVIGTVEEGAGNVYLKTTLDTYRRLPPPTGILLPRIC